jgi:serine/threonine protein kinase
MANNNTSNSNSNIKKLLNFNTIYKKSLHKKHPSLSLLTKNIGKLFHAAYEFSRFVGNGIQGDIYIIKRIGSDTEYICKTIENINEGLKSNIEKEITMLQNLSSNLNSKSYVVPCINHIFHENTAYLIFPLKTGYKLKNIYPILDELRKHDETLYNEVIMYLFRQIVKALAVIHQKRIAHQNLDASSIHVSTNIKKIKTLQDIGKLEVSIVDFGLSCSGNNKQSSCLKEPTYFLNNSSNRSFTKRIVAATKIAKTLKTLQPDAELVMAQRYDIWCCGKILYESINHGRKNNKKINKYINEALDNDKSWHNDFKLKPINFDDSESESDAEFNKTSNKLKLYNTFIEQYMLVPILKRKTANYIINKLLIFSKY